MKLIASGSNYISLTIFVVIFGVILYCTNGVVLHQTVMPLVNIYNRVPLPLSLELNNETNFMVVQLLSCIIFYIFLLGHSKLYQ